MNTRSLCSSEEGIFRILPGTRNAPVPIAHRHLLYPTWRITGNHVKGGAYTDIALQRVLQRMLAVDGRWMNQVGPTVA